MEPSRPTLSSVFRSLPLACALAALVAMPSAQAQQFWRTDGTSGTWVTGTNWGATALATGGSAWVSGSNVQFTANSAATFATTTVGNVTVADGVTVTVSPAGTLSTGSASARTYDIGTGSTLTWTTQNVSTAANQAGFIKSGEGIWNIGAQANAYNASNSGFTLNAGTVIVSGNNSFGGTNSLLTINGGTIQSSTIRTYANNIVIGGNFTNSGSGTATFSGTVDLGAAPRTITNSFTGARVYSGIISGAAGLTFDGSGTGTHTLSGANTYTGATTVSAGALQVGSGGLGQTGTGAVTVQSGSTLLGTGAVQGTTFTLDDGGTLRPGDSLADSSHGTLTFTPVSPSGDTSLQGNIVLGISGATITDTTYGGNLLGSAGYNTWVDGVSGVGTHDRLVFLGSSGHNVSFLTTTGRLEVVGSGFTPARGQVFNLMDWSGLMNPNFTGFTFNSYVTGNGDEGADMDLPDISGSGLAWDLSRFTTSGNMVVIPEPSRTVLMLVGLAGLALRRRRRVNRA